MMFRPVAALALLAATAVPAAGQPSLNWPSKGNCPDGSQITAQEYTDQYQCFNNAECQALDPNACCVWYSYAFCGYPGTNHGGSADTECNAYNRCMDAAEEKPRPTPTATSQSAEPADPMAELMAQANLQAGLEALQQCPGIEPQTGAFDECVKGIADKLYEGLKANMPGTSTDTGTSSSASSLAKTLTAGIAALGAAATTLLN